MRIGTRITLTIAALLVLVLGVHGVLSLRSFRSARQAHLENEARTLASAMRALVEEGSLASAMAAVPALQKKMERAGARWVPEVFDSSEAPSPDDPPSSDPRLERLRKVVAIRGPIVEETTTYGQPVLIYLEPVFAPAPRAPEGQRVVGAIQLTGHLSSIDAEVSSESLNVFLSLGLIFIVILAGVAMLATRRISRPIGELIAGIDDVGRGDLSRVLLLERDDEIGALATRFNAMTASLREARIESSRNADQMRRTDKLATIGRVAAELAHEVGTPLNVVIGRARTMAKRADDPEAVQKNSGIIAEQASRIARIIQRLLDLARRQAPCNEKEPISLGQLARDTLELVEHQIANAQIEQRIDLAEALPPIPGDRDRLQQVLLNLYVNAIQAMPKGGVLRIENGSLRRRRPGLELAPEQEYVFLRVADTGSGIKAQNRERIFDPFYTTKASMGGTGLGLAVAKGIVNDHDGWIEVDDNSSEGSGAVFQVFFPTGP
ncbi:MAG: ATP-binding protein [Pseudomonadota bacterium]